MDPPRARDVKDLLLAPRLEPEEVKAILSRFGVRDPARADGNLQSIAEDPLAREALAEVLPELLTAVARSADADQALNLLERFVRASLGTRSLLSHFRSDPRALELLVLAFGASPFLAEILIRAPTWFYWVADPAVRFHPRTMRDITKDVTSALRAVPSEERQRQALRIAKRRELLHIGVRDLLRLASVEETVASLSALADVLIEKAFEISDAALRAELALPRRKTAKDAFVVIGLGKLGGEELNFSSDVDLMYVYATDEGRMAAAEDAPSRGDFARKLGRRLTAALADLGEEGALYRVDLRLRPEGRVGKVAHTLAEAEEYYRDRASTWERLALLKARPVAGDRALGERFLKEVRPFVFGRPFGAPELAEVREVKRRLDQKIAERAETDRHVKLGFGGIREIEFVVQALQLRHGQRRPELRERGTLPALRALHEGGVLAESELRELEPAYVFLRDVENKLQMVADTQTHTLPAENEALRACALRLGYADGPAPAEELLRRDYRRHTTAAHRVFVRVFEETAA
jgi:[glutamine synthetase] adenylyltransferase / [glutamine synthetase]-adenylyl-L-tyrosine phosphorylase